MCYVGADVCVGVDLMLQFVRGPHGRASCESWELLRLVMVKLVFALAVWNATRLDVYCMMSMLVFGVGVFGYVFFFCRLVLFWCWCVGVGVGLGVGVGTRVLFSCLVLSWCRWRYQC